MSLQYAIVVCGRICSGKSTIVRHIAATFHFDIVLFGDFIRDKAMSLGMNESRRNYQDLGQELLAQLGAHGLVRGAIEFAKKTNLNRAVFDGVRQTSVLDEIRELADTTIVIYLEVDELTRYERFRRRYNYCSLQEFREYDNHPVERSVVQLANAADRMIMARRLDTVISEVDMLIRKRLGSS